MRASALENRRVIFWLYGFQVGGAERQALAFAEYLRTERGADVELWAFENHGPITARCDEASIPWRVVTAWPNRQTARTLAGAAYRAGRALREARADLVLPYMTPANIVCGLGWRISGARGCVWNQRSGGFDRIHPRLERYAARSSTALVANSRQGADHLAETLHARRDRIVVIPNAVELSPSPNGPSWWRERLGATASSFVVTMIANLHRWKDHETLIRAWARACPHLRERNLDPILALAGDDRGSLPTLRQLAADLGVAQHVSFLGLVDDVAGLLAASDVAVLLNRFEDYEGCPNAVIESMASGLPIIASDTAGPREALGDELRECLVPPGDSDAVASRLLSLAGNPSLRKESGERARERAQREFSRQATFDRYANLLSEIAATGRLGRKHT